MTLFERHAGVYVIAEVGINHDGDIAAAKQLIQSAAAAGVQGVKIQVRDLPSVYAADVLCDSKRAEQGTQYILSELRKSSLPPEQVAELFEFGRGFPVDFFATPFSSTSADLLQELGCPIFKIGSPELTNLPLIRQVAGYGKPMILSTGMCTEDEVRQVAGYLHEVGASFTLLHCNSTYPAAPDELHLRYLNELARVADCRVGYSGHEQGFVPTLAAVSLGATVIERHITFDTSAAGPDHSASLTAGQFAEMVDAIRIVERSLGGAVKHFGQGEQANRVTLAKSIVAARPIPAGAKVTTDMLTVRSPARGVSPLLMDRFIGQRTTRPLRQDEPVLFEDFRPAQNPVRRVSIPRTWGIVGRLNDFEEFLDVRPDLVEVHLAWRDIEEYRTGGTRFMRDEYAQDLVVHAPEYYDDKLIDFTSEDPAVTEYSLEMLSTTFELSRSLASRFKGATHAEGPRVVVHPGGHFSKPTEANRSEQYARLVSRLRSLDTSGVRVVMENMPPFPWYFGGQWFNTVFVDSREIAEFAGLMGWGICYDLSHAQLYCNHVGKPLADYTREILDHVAYLHISDARSVTEEGVQLGEGDLDLDHLFHILDRLDVGFIPEIWNGHLRHGAGMRQALRTIEELLDRKLAGRSHYHPTSGKTA